MGTKIIDGIKHKGRAFKKKVTGDKRLLKVLIGGALAIVVIVIILRTLLGHEVGPSYVKKSSKKLIDVEISTVAKVAEKSSPETTETIQNDVMKENEPHFVPLVSYAKPEKAAPRTKVRQKREITYRAKQVIERSDPYIDSAGIAIGKNFIGKLLLPLDTRDSDKTVKVLLPYGSGQRGDVIIPKGALLWGTFNYHNGDKRISLRFNRCIFPDGKEYKVEAQALDSSDYKSGIKGDYYSNATTRIAKTLGLSMVSGAAEVFTEKTILADGYSVTPKATMKNALMQGTANAANVELERQIQGMSQHVDEYMVIPSGRELIINLTGSFKGEVIGK